MRQRANGASDLKVHLTYHSEVEGREVELPFVVGVVGDLRGATPRDHEPLSEREFQEVSKPALDHLVSHLRPSVVVSIPDTHMAEVSSLRLEFLSLEDFAPEPILRRIPPAARRIRVREILVDLKARTQGDRTARHPAYGRETVLDQEEATARAIDDAIKRLVDVDPSSRAYAAALDQARGALLEKVPSRSRIELTQLMDLRIAELDDQLSDLVDAVLHDPAFQQLESLWRSLDLLCRRAEIDPMVMVKVLDISREEIAQDLSAHIAKAAYDRSLLLETHLFRLIYSNEFGQFGGHPFGIIVVDDQITPDTEDVRILERLATIGEAAHCPVLAAAAPKMFAIDDFDDRDWDQVNLETYFEDARFDEWRALRASPVSRYLGLVLPRFLIRDRITTRAAARASLPYTERVSRQREALWGNGAFAFASVVMQAFIRHRWCVAITGLDGGGAATGLPAPGYGTGEGPHVFRRAVDRVISTRRERDLAVAGFIPMVQRPGQVHPVFYSAFSANAPSKAVATDPTSARLSARLPYLLAASRIAHYVKANMRERIGGEASLVKLQSDVSRWIAQYVAYQDNVDDEVKAERPLRDARVTIFPSRDEPGRFTFHMEVQPHFQLEELGVSLAVGTL
jgi:type VI secretion system protein ImpC